jgi:hypothetical protein
MAGIASATTPIDDSAAIRPLLDMRSLLLFALSIFVGRENAPVAPIRQRQNDVLSDAMISEVLMNTVTATAGAARQAYESLPYGCFGRPTWNQYHLRISPTQHLR